MVNKINRLKDYFYLKPIFNQSTFIFNVVDSMIQSTI